MQDAMMLWPLKKFGWLFTLVAFWLGILAVPSDFLSADSSIRVWKRVFTVGNREIALGVLLGICLLRLGYVDLKYAVNDDDWASIRQKLRHALGAIFKKDRRIAELKLISEDEDLNTLYAAARSQLILEKVNWELPPFPVPTGARHSFEILSAFNTGMSQHLLRLEEAIEAPVANRIWEVAKQKAATEPPHWATNGTLFVNDLERQQWNDAFWTHTKLKDMLVGIRGVFSSKAGQWRLSPLSAKRDFPRQLLRDIEAEIQR